MDDDLETAAQVQPNEVSFNPYSNSLGIIKGIKGSVIIAEPKLELTKYIKPLYITVLLDEQPVPRILVDNGAVVSILPTRMLKRLCKDETR